MGMDYNIVVIGGAGEVARRLEMLGYGVYCFKNARAAARFPGREFFDVFVDVKKGVVFRPDGAQFPIGATPEAAVKAAVSARPDEEDFSPELALRYLNGSYRLYGNVLERYRDAYGNLEEELHDLLARGDYPAIRAVIHRIKGVSLNIGSARLYHLCGLLEARLDRKTGVEEIELFIHFHRRILKHCKKQGELCSQTQKS